MLPQPRSQPVLGVAVARRRVDVVDPALEHELERLRGLALRDLGEGSGAEDHARRVVARAAEGCDRNRVHASTVRQRVQARQGVTSGA